MDHKRRFDSIWQIKIFIKYFNEIKQDLLIMLCDYYAENEIWSYQFRIYWKNRVEYFKNHIFYLIFKMNW